MATLASPPWSSPGMVDAPYGRPRTNPGSGATASVVDGLAAPDDDSRGPLEPVPLTTGALPNGPVALPGVVVVVAAGGPAGTLTLTVPASEDAELVKTSPVAPGRTALMRYVY